METSACCTSAEVGDVYAILFVPSVDDDFEAVG